MSNALYSKRLSRTPKRSSAPVRKSWRDYLRFIGWIVLQIPLAPFRILRALRRSMTTASVSLMLITFMTLNVIWGYPWTGMMAACIAALAVGWATNLALRPRLVATCSLPSSAPAEQPIRVIAHARNTRRLPSMDVCIGFVAPYSRSRREDDFQTSTWDYFGLIKPGQHVDHHATIQFDRRGVYQMPPLLIQSTFPFFLFRWRGQIDLNAEIAITPRLLSGDQNASARHLLSTVGGWAHKLLAGTAVEYTGSREYQVGMPVRRWDFASWARLGRPIVREYESPSVCSIALVVDTAEIESDVVSAKSRSKSAEIVDEEFERLLSLAATAITDLVNRSVQVDLFVTSEAIDGVNHEKKTASGDSESLMIRLAKAEKVSQETADQRIRDAIELAGRQPTLVLTCRSGYDWLPDARSNVSVIHVASNVIAQASLEVVA